MSLYRNVHVSMWGDAKFRALSDDGQKLWLYFLTGPETTSVPGCIGAGKASLSEGIGWSGERFEAAFQELADKGMARADWGARFVWLPNSIRYGKPSSSKNVIGWMPYLDVLPECRLKDLAIGAMWGHLLQRGESFMQPFVDRFGMRYLRECLAALDAASEEEEEAPSHAPSDAASEAPSDAPSDAPFSEGDPPASGAGKDRERKGSGSGSSSSNSAGAEPDPGGDEQRRGGALLRPVGSRTFGPGHLVDLWNELAHPAMPRVRDLTGGRRRKIETRLREHPDPGWWREVIEAANASPHCRGESKPAAGANRPWRCTLDFLVDNDTNALKVLEGVYGDDREAAPGEPPRRKRYG